MKHLSVAAVCLILSIHLFSQNYITLYSDCEYGGKEQKLRIGQHKLSSTTIGLFNLSSIKIPSGFKVTLFTALEPGTGYSKIVLTSDAACLKDAKWNDKANSLIVEDADEGWTASGTDNYFNSNQVTLYSNCGYGGNRKSFDEGSYDVKQLGIGDNELSSIKIPYGWSITIYQNEGFGGGSQEYTFSVDCLNSNWNDHVSSIKVKKSKTANPNYVSSKVTLYRDCNFSGGKKSFTEGRYDINELGVGNDAASSISIPPGWKITLYKNGGFSGNSVEFSSDADCLGSGWNDEVSSIVVKKL